jgi:glycosyltransferase involved in cell wall biosynthesis
MPYNAARFYKKEIIQYITKNISGQYDIIQFEGLYALLYIQAFREKGKRMVFRPHNVENDIWIQRSRHTANPLKKTYLRNLHKRLKRLENNLINQYDLLVPISKNDLQYFQEAGNLKPTQVSPGGIDAKNISKTVSPPKNQSIFFIGALDWEPNLEGLKWFIEEVWPGILSLHPYLTLHIAGRNAPVKWKKYFNRHVEFAGEVNNAHQFMQSHSIMIVPLFSGSGMRIKIIEGMALGKVIIGTTVAFKGIDCTDDQNALVADSKEQFITKTTKILSDNQLFIETSKNAMHFIKENFDNFEIVADLLNFYSKHI